MSKEFRTLIEGIESALVVEEEQLDEVGKMAAYKDAYGEMTIDSTDDETKVFMQKHIDFLRGIDVDMVTELIMSADASTDYVDDDEIGRVMKRGMDDALTARTDGSIPGKIRNFIKDIGGKLGIGAFIAGMGSFAGLLAATNDPATATDYTGQVWAFTGAAFAVSWRMGIASLATTTFASVINRINRLHAKLTMTDDEIRAMIRQALVDQIQSQIDGIEEEMSYDPTSYRLWTLNAMAKMKREGKL